MDAAIKTERFTKTYGKNRGIRDVDLEVVEGAVFGFLGPNGAGKTTIRTLLGFMRPTAEPKSSASTRKGRALRCGRATGTCRTSSPPLPAVSFRSRPPCRARQRDPSRLDDAPS